ncbi:MAG: tetratricopeptide repeat protein [Desulfobacteraceae bacterium]
MICAVGCQAGRSAQNAGPRPEALATYESTSSFYLFAAAQFKLKEGDVNAAIRLLGQAVKLDTSSAYLKLELVNLLLIKKEDQHALKLVEQVLSQDPDNIQALTLAGGIYQKQKMTRIIPDSYAAFYFFGKVLSAEGKLEAAESALLRSLELEPSLEEPRAELLKIYQTQNKPAKIAKTYQSMLALDPDNHRAALGLAEHYRQMNKPALSLKLLKDLGRRVDRDGSIISAIFEMFVETKQYEEALWALEGVLQSAPSNSDLHYMAGITLDGMERDDEALKHLAQVQPGSKFYNNAVIHSALLYHDMGKMNRAIGVVQAALAHDPDNADYYLYLGSFYEELERYDEALKIFQEGLRRDDKNARLHFHIGVVYDKMGSRQDSISAIKAVLKLTPNDAEALNYLGYTYADMGINLDEAETLIQTALRLKPDDGYITDSLGWVYFKRGQYTRALKWLNKAVQLVPDDPTILEHIGDVYLQMDSREKALTFYQRSLKKKEKDRQALKEKIRNLQSHEK